MNAASQAASPELRLGLSRAIRAVGVDIGAGVGLVHKRIEFLTVMHARIGHVILPDQLVPGIRIDVVLVAKEALAVFLGPARILVFLPVLGRILLPLLRRLADLYGLILFAAVALLGHRHDRGINHLAATRNIALRLQMMAKALEQSLDQAGLRQRLTEQPQRRGRSNIDLLTMRRISGTRILVFLPVLGRILLPLLRRLADLYGLILFAAVALLGHRHN